MLNVRVFSTKGATYKCQFCMENTNDYMVKMGEANAHYCFDCLIIEWWAYEVIAAEDDRKKAIGFLASTITGELSNG